jgi:hypothetical protein
MLCNVLALCNTVILYLNCENFIVIGVRKMEGSNMSTERNIFKRWTIFLSVDMLLFSIFLKFIIIQFAQFE